ncbi:MAG TPA: hypothetical protein VFX59_30910, partial [Polyangiales bacterium]|nr:hypothetical protein [Polyangiales bacterium]
SLFGWDGSFLADWPDAKKYRQGDFMTHYAIWVAKQYSDRQNGFLETIEDGVIRSFYGIGVNNCTGSIDNPIDGPLFTNSLLTFRKALQGTSTSTFYIQGGEHVSLEWPEFYTNTAGGASLVDWFAKLVNNKSAGNYGP